MQRYLRWWQDGYLSSTGRCFDVGIAVASKEEILSPGLYQGSLVPEVAEIFAGSYKVKNPPAIVGSGYVVRSLEAALWAFYRSSSFERGGAIGRESGQRCRYDLRYLRTVGRRDVWNVGDSATMAGTSCDAKAYQTNGGSAVDALRASRVCCSLPRLKSFGSCFRRCDRFRFLLPFGRSRRLRSGATRKTSFLVR
jgi:hypothetical protein